MPYMRGNYLLPKRAFELIHGLKVEKVPAGSLFNNSWTNLECALNCEGMSIFKVCSFKFKFIA